MEACSEDIRDDTEEPAAVPDEDSSEEEESGRHSDCSSGEKSLDNNIPLY